MNRLLSLFHLQPRCWNCKVKLSQKGRFGMPKFCSDRCEAEYVEAESFRP